MNYPKTRKDKSGRAKDAGTHRSKYRSNVAIVVSNNQGQVLLAQRIRDKGWQFPQGGVDAGESPYQSMVRELYEEVGIAEQHIKVIAETKDWLRYKLPPALRSRSFMGQKQKWYLLKFNGTDDNISLDHSPEPEFTQWQWVSYWYPLQRIINFKRPVYRLALTQFAPVLCHALSVKT